MPQPLTAEALETPKTRQGAKVLPLHEEQPSRPAPVTSGTPEPGDALDDMAEILDRGVHAGIARLTFGLSPAALAGAYLDWAAHLAFSPGKQAQLFGKALRKWARLGNYALGCCVNGGRGEPCIDPLPQDRRFSAEEWQGWPYNFLHQSFPPSATMVAQRDNRCGRGHEATRERHRVRLQASPRHDVAVKFRCHKPVVQARTLQTGGRNLVEGARNFLEDWEHLLRNKPPVGAEKFKVGRAVAVTPGKVVYRNRLIELIQYAPRPRPSGRSRS